MNCFLCKDGKAIALATMRDVETNENIMSYPVCENCMPKEKAEQILSPKTTLDPK